MALLTKAAFLASALLSTRTLAQSCVSYGVDFQSGGSYFQNISSTDDFSFVSVFEGCQDDVANNILVDPNGDEYQCTDTPLQPDDTNQMATCPMQKDDMFTGDWSVIIISNNGDSDPIAYERDFYVSVGVPQTYTFTPTLTLTAVTTPILNVTSTDTQTFTTTSTVTTTVPSKTYSPTVTSTPSKVTTTITKTVGTVKKTARVVIPSIVTKSRTATCSIPARQTFPDPTCTITPTLVTAAALQTDAAKAKFRRVPDAIAILDRDTRIAERKARLAERRAIAKRTPDAATVTVTDTNTADYITTTTTSTAPTSTMSITVAASITTTLTTTTTVQSGKTTLPVVTVTAATPTVTKTRYTVLTTTVATSTRTQTITVTSTFVPTASASICRIKGGVMK
ncbi:hypothetical protein AAFC00_004766 [Neodothiora populina]|uniref:Uncharacterized protein n=1 Tax=Neodothiora populina TaxID=2781224 RepID=A0ABR3P332_9PEZI